MPPFLALLENPEAVCIFYGSASVNCVHSDVICVIRSDFPRELSMFLVIVLVIVFCLIVFCTLSLRVSSDVSLNVQ